MCYEELQYFKSESSSSKHTGCFPDYSRAIHEQREVPMLLLEKREIIGISVPVFNIPKGINGVVMCI